VTALSEYREILKYEFDKDFKSEDRLIKSYLNCYTTNVTPAVLLSEYCGRDSVHSTEIKRRDSILLRKRRKNA
jgi:hypothetical protein